MPSTITTYHTFNPATKARSSEVNANFSNYRGDILPINEATISASNNTHYLGASDHYWAGAYVGQLDFVTSTTTATLILKGDTSATAGAYLFQIEGVNKLKVAADGVELSGQTTTVNPIFKVAQAVTTGAMDLLFGTSTITSWDSGGLQRAGIDVGFYTTASAPIGNYVLTGVTTLATVSNLSGTGQTISVNRINTRGGGIVKFCVFKGALSSSDSGLVQKYSNFGVDLYRGLTTTSLSLINTFICPVAASIQPANGAADRIGQTNIEFNYYDSSYSAGEVVYQTIIRSTTVPTTTGSELFSCTAAIFISEI
jgi:hypothetical protein